MEQRTERVAGTVLALSAFFLFLGRGWEYLFQEGPFRTLFWDEGLMKPIIHFLGGKWGEYVAASGSDRWIPVLTRLTGTLFILLLPFPFMSQRSWARKGLLFAFFLYTFLSLLFFKEAFYRIGTLIEHSAQLGTPLLLYYWSLDQKGRTIKLAKILIALTFLGHALYAAGHYPVPGNFIDMVIKSFGVGEGTARSILIGAGVLDILACILLFIPATRYPALLYMLLWGTLTTLARTYAHFQVEFPGYSLAHWIPHTLYRIPHATLPLFLLLYERKLSLTPKGNTS